MDGSLRVSVIVPYHTFGIDGGERLNALAADAQAYGGETIAVAYGDVAEAALAAVAVPGVRVARAADAGAYAYAAAANAGARLAGGTMLLFVHDARPQSSGWLARLLSIGERPDTGAAGPRLTGGGADETGRFLRPARFNQFGFTVETFSGLTSRAECDAISSACLLTSRALFEETGGFDEAFDNELEALDYCLRVRQRGKRVMVDGGAIFERVAVAPADADPRRSRAARYAFAERWREAAVPRDNVWPERTKNAIRRDEMLALGFLREFLAAPDITVIVHGPAPALPDAFRSSLYRTQYGVGSVIWTCPGTVPDNVQGADDAVAAARRATERRGDGYVAFVRGDTELAPNWLGELIDAIEYAPDTIAATVVAPGEDGGGMPCSADARCTLVAPRFVPQDMRLRDGLSLNDAVGDWIARAAVAGRDIRCVRRPATVVGAPEPDAGFAALWGQPLETYRRPAPVRLAATVTERPAPFASIVTLSFNAAHFTEVAVASIHAHTRMPYEIIVIDNGSEPGAVARLGRLPNVRVIYNARNTGFAFGCNQGIAAARGTHVVLLNNDVVVTDGWLEALIDVQRRNPTVGVSAPRSNRVTGVQQIDNVPYRSIPAMHVFAAQRSVERRGWAFRFVRAIGFCLCIDRRVLDEIGGLDPRYGIGNFEDDDFCIRVRAAGYDIAICEDSFVHHFGEGSFLANKIDYQGLSTRNRAIFEQRWDVVMPAGAPFDARPLIRRGFDRVTDFVPLPPATGVAADWLAPA